MVVPVELVMIKKRIVGREGIQEVRNLATEAGYLSESPQLHHMITEPLEEASNMKLTTEYFPMA